MERRLVIGRTCDQPAHARPKPISTRLAESCTAQHFGSLCGTMDLCPVCRLRVLLMKTADFRPSWAGTSRFSTYYLEPGHFTNKGEQRLIDQSCADSAKICCSSTILMLHRLNSICIGLNKSAVRIAPLME
jgi:hypothetical protein